MNNRNPVTERALGSKLAGNRRTADLFQRQIPRYSFAGGSFWVWGTIARRLVRTGWLVEANTRDVWQPAEGLDWAAVSAALGAFFVALHCDSTFDDALGCVSPRTK